jgi:hypothetical protein
MCDPADGVMVTVWQVVKLREQLIEEGRRLRYLMTEEVEVVRLEVERLRDIVVRVGGSEQRGRRAGFAMTTLEAVKY